MNDDDDIQSVFEDIWREAEIQRRQREITEWWNPAAVWRTWRRQRACFHGQPANWQPAGEAGSSYVVSLGLIDLGRAKLWECSIPAGGCGRRWT